MCNENSDCKLGKVVSGIIITASLCTVLAAAALVVHNVSEKKRVGGKLLKVNYKFAKEFDD